MCSQVFSFTENTVDWMDKKKSPRDKENVVYCFKFV